MQIEIREAAPEEAPALQALLQLYLYDFSELDGSDLGPDGRYAPYDLGPFWTDPGHRAFLVRVAGRLAGLALVEQVASLADGQPTWDMAEFFVLRRYRRQGVGTTVARSLFERFPGRWQVRQIPENAPAQAFWRRVIGDYTDGHFRETVFEDARWRGPAQFFQSAGARPGTG